MPTKRITKTDVDKLPSGGSIWDEAVPGFGVRRRQGPHAYYFFEIPERGPAAMVHYWTAWRSLDR